MASSILEIIDKQDWLEEAGDKIQPAVINTFKAGGEAGKAAKNFLHGKWLGHPVHPMITDIPLGAWTASAVLDAYELGGEKKYAPGADAALGVGIVGAAGAAVTGLTDWSGTTSIERKTGLLHGMLNMGATALYLASYVMRRKKQNRKTAISLSMLGYGISLAAAYLGGSLVFNKQVGVNHTAVPDGYPEEFTAVLAEDELPEGSMKCVQAKDVNVLLLKKENQIYAIANTCSHMGGPLAQGELLDDCQVRCPWHGSVFSIVDGSVIDGPATEPQPTFHVRVIKGQIEVKLKDGWV